MRPTPATPALLRELNERAVLEVIRGAHPISRADVARRAGLSKPTVSLSLQSLLEAGLVREVGVSSGRPGRGALLFEPVAEAGYVLGIDIGARFVRGAIADIAGVVRARRDVATPRAEFAAALAVAAELRHTLEHEVDVAGRIVATCVGVPAAIGPVDGLAWLGAFGGLDGLDVAQTVADAIGLPAAIENDVNLAALGEREQGLGRGVADFAFVSIGSGLGVGLVLSGELYRGARGAAGEVDLVPFRSVVQGPAAAAAIDPSADGVARLLERDDRPADIPAAFERARTGDRAALAVVATEARWIALYVAAITAVVDPELVVLGGGIGANGDLLLDPVRATLAELLPRPPRVETSSLGSEVVLAGALAVARREALDHVFVQRTIRERSTA